MEGERSQTIRVLSVDDHPAFREGIAVFVGTQSDMQLVAEAAIVRGAIERTRARSGSSARLSTVNTPKVGLGVYPLYCFETIAIAVS